MLTCTLKLTLALALGCGVEAELAAPALTALPFMVKFCV